MDVAPKKPRLRFRQEPQEKGLASMTQGVRGWELWYGDKSVAYVYPITNSTSRWTAVGWYWVAGGDGVPRKNTRQEWVITPEEAKNQCMAYVKEHLGKEGAT